MLLALGMSARARVPDQRSLPLGDQAAVLEACHGEPATLDQLGESHPDVPSQVVGAVRALERDGWMERSRGLCWPQ